MSAATTRRRVFVEQIMGTAISVHLIHEDALSPAVEDAVDGCFAELRDIDRVFSTYRSDSDISRLRRGETTEAQLDPRLTEVHRECDGWALRTRGLFDADRDGLFDPTGYVKGWSVEAAARRHLAPLLERPGMVAVGINAGGDMQLFTAPSADWSWNVGIADPFRPGSMLATIEVVNGAVATSGSAERGTHILDPRTGEPATGAVSATVVAESLTVADIWATTAVVAGLEDLAWLADATGIAGTRSGLIVGSDGSIRRWLGTTEITVSTAETTLTVTAA